MTTINVQNLTVNVSPGIDSLPVFLGSLKLTSEAANTQDVSERFTTSDDGTTVTDHKTGLTWSKDKLGGKGDYESAEMVVAACRLGGHDDWRIPTRVELESILDLKRYNPAIDPSFACDTNYAYWTNTELASSSDDVWVVLFYYGSVNSSNRVSSAFVRAVRGASPAGQ